MIDKLLSDSGVKCAFNGHTADKGRIVFDIPMAPAIIDDKYMYDGFVCMEWTKCADCGDLISTEKKEATDERIENELP